MALAGPGARMSAPAATKACSGRARYAQWPQQETHTLKPRRADGRERGQGPPTSSAPTCPSSAA